MRRAATITGLKEAQPVSIWIDTTPTRCCNFWAPEFFLLDGPNGPRWYGYYAAGTLKCCDNQHMHVIESVGADPLGPYTYKGQLSDSAGGWAIDASILQLDGAQIMGFNHATLGYDSVQLMFDAFSVSERDQIVGFFNFLRGCATESKRIAALQALDFVTFARLYNGPGQAVQYGAAIRTAYNVYYQLRQR